MKTKSQIVVEYIEAIIIAVLLALVIRFFVVQAYKIPSGSMLETLQIGDRLLVSKYSYGIRLPFSDTILIEWDEPAFGDIIVFEYPRDPSKDYIKRLVGLPGDTIEMRDKVLYRNGEAVQEEYLRFLSPHSTMPQRDFFDPIVVPEGQYFMLGDNRDDSQDSRFWGFVERRALKGKAWLIYWSWEEGEGVRWDRIGQAVQ